jgi:hypothetical protein
MSDTIALNVAWLTGTLRAVLALAEREKRVPAPRPMYPRMWSGGASFPTDEGIAAYAERMAERVHAEVCPVCGEHRSSLAGPA